MRSRFCMSEPRAALCARASKIAINGRPRRAVAARRIVRSVNKSTPEFEKFKRSAAAQRRRLLGEYGLDRNARARNVEAVLLHQVLAVGQDRIGVLHDLQPLIVII